MGLFSGTGVALKPGTGVGLFSHPVLEIVLIDPDDKYTLKKIMHGICMSYTKYFNYKYKKCGHLWQGRYKTRVIQKDQYLINCATYIEMNPVRAKICLRPEDYPWSSYPARALGKPDEILDDFKA